jgi:uncharacterized protein with beta-barrel porin domain
MKVTGQQTSSWASADTPGYQVNTVTTRLGGQHEIAPDWFLGGALGVGQTWSTANGGSSGTGQIVDGSVAVKHTMGPWLLAGSIALANGSFDNERVVTLPAATAVLQSSPRELLAGARLRAAYEFAFSTWYVRPYGDIDVTYTDAPGFQESGPAERAQRHQNERRDLADGGIRRARRIGCRYDAAALCGGRDQCPAGQHTLCRCKLRRRVAQ